LYNRFVARLAFVALLASGAAFGCDGVFGITEIRGAGSGVDSGVGSGSCASICFVQSANELAVGGIPKPLAFSRPPVAGNLVVLAVGTFNNAITKVADTANNTYLMADLVVSPGGTTLTLFYAANIQVTTPFEVTVTTQPSGSCPEATLAVHEYEGAATMPLDKQSGNPGFGTTPDTGPVTTAVGGELYFAMMAHDGPATSSSRAPYVLRERPTDDTVTHTSLITEDMTGPAEMTSATFGLSASSGWAAMLATFLPTSQ
jgi:hypothetical protein